MKYVLLTLVSFICSAAVAQNTDTKLAAAIKQLEADAQFKHAILSMYVVDSKTGKIVFDKNAQIGLAPASCQKVVTSVSAFELLGKEYRYKTYIGKDFAANNKYDAGCLFIIGSGDPTLGSWRWKETKDTMVFSKILSALQKQNIFSFDENLIIQDQLYGVTPLPEGWIWQDIGNYYGAACFGFNWNENQYDLVLKPGEKGDLTHIVKTKPALPGLNLKNTITTAASGTGDNGYIYSSPFSNLIITKGTIPLQKTPFTISGSMPNPSDVFQKGLFNYLFSNKITFKGKGLSGNTVYINNIPIHSATHIIDSILSPPLDSMNYWFLKKSINLYGEAFLKSLVQQELGFAKGDETYEKAIAIIKNFWQQKGIEPAALNIIDGSGLSPANRVTTNALVTVMQYAQQQKWFTSFYNALPEMNGIKMKDGYINGVRSYTGYVKSKTGNDYTFSFIVNNFDGSAATVREKMWKVLDILK
jgi:serine-type D-Ala-D-Ala carboxypeptidase/endopeptidase (penicillin-binding protein 4)